MSESDNIQVLREEQRKNNFPRGTDHPTGYSSWAKARNNFFIESFKSSPKRAPHRNRMPLWGVSVYITNYG